MKRLRRAAVATLRWARTRLRVGFLLLGKLDPSDVVTDVVTFAGLGGIYLGFRIEDMPLVVVGGLVTMIGIRGARVRERMEQDAPVKRER